MSDIQELIHKTSMDCIEKGQRMEQERIIKLLESSDIVYDFRGCGCCSDAELKDVIALIKGKEQVSEKKIQPDPNPHIKWWL